MDANMLGLMEIPLLLFSVAQALLQEMCIPLKKQELKELMREVDTDGSGEVDFDEVGVHYILLVLMLSLLPPQQLISLIATQYLRHPRSCLAARTPLVCPLAGPTRQSCSPEQNGLTLIH